jgi:hypothetical protein
MNEPELDYQYEDFLDAGDVADSTFVDGEDATKVDSDFVEEQKETARAKKYRLKTRHGINFLIAGLVQSPGTVTDAAALLYHGPDVSAAIGQLADHDIRVRKAIDFITEDTIDNPYAIAALAMVPLAIQILRNHEPAVQQLPGRFAKLRIKLPFSKRYIHIPMPKLNLRWTRNVSYEPNYMVEHVLGDPNVQAAFAKRGIKIAWPAPFMNGSHG